MRARLRLLFFFVAKLVMRLLEFFLKVDDFVVSLRVLKFIYLSLAMEKFVLEFFFKVRIIARLVGKKHDKCVCNFFTSSLVLDWICGE